MSNKELNHETANGTNNVLAISCYQIDFGNHLRCKLKVENNQITVEGVINGLGDSVPLEQVVIVELQ